jgi:hypothetical protein
VAASLKVDPAQGLAADEAARRLGRSGPNALPEAPLPGLGWLLLGQLQSPLRLGLAPLPLLGTEAVKAARRRTLRRTTHVGESP